MKARAVAVLLGCVLLLGSAFAQKKSSGKAGAPDKAMLQQVLDAWGSGDVSQPAKFYDHAPDDVFYDIAPLKYNGWSEYADGAKRQFETLQAIKFTINDDAVVRHAGNLAWTTATVKTVMTPKSGAPSTLDCRWTTVWEKKGGKWLIVHDHFSAPMPEEPK